LGDIRVFVTRFHEVQGLLSALIEGDLDHVLWALHLTPSCEGDVLGGEFGEEWHYVLRFDVMGLIPALMTA